VFHSERISLASNGSGAGARNQVKPLITADATVVQGILQPRAQLPRLANGDSQNSTKRLTAAKLDLFHREVPPMTHSALSLASEIRDLLASDMQTTGCWMELVSVQNGSLVGELLRLSK
jgi:hypothetical protein